MTSKQEQQMMQQAEQSADYLGADDMSISDPLELLYKFIFDPNSKFPEITKSWSLTYLNNEDVYEIKSLAGNIRIYDQEKFYEEQEVREKTDEQRVYVHVTCQSCGQVHKASPEYDYSDEACEGCGSATLVQGERVYREPVYRYYVVYKSRFTDLIEKDLGRIDAILASAGGRRGALVRAFRSTYLKQDQSLEDKTTPKTGWFGKK